MTGVIRRFLETFKPTFQPQVEEKKEGVVPSRATSLPVKQEGYEFSSTSRLYDQLGKIEWSLRELSSGKPMKTGEVTEAIKWAYTNFDSVPGTKGLTKDGQRVPLSEKQVSNYALHLLNVFSAHIRSMVNEAPNMQALDNRYNLAQQTFWRLSEHITQDGDKKIAAELAKETVASVEKRLESFPGADAATLRNNMYERKYVGLGTFQDEANIGKKLLFQYKYYPSSGVL